MSGNTVCGLSSLKIGNYCSFEKLNEVGKTIIFASVVLGTGAICGGSLACAVGGKTLAAKMIGNIVGAGIAYKVAEKFIDWAIRDSLRIR